LKDVNIAVTDPVHAAPTTWTPGYVSGLTIGRYDGSPNWLAGNNLGSNAVTLQDSAIDIDLSTQAATQFTSGIYVVGNPTDITITSNNVKATGYATKATQALNIAIWDQSIAISNNTFEGYYGGTTPFSRHGGAPASAIFIGRVYAAGGGGSNIAANNILKSSVYSFYFNAFDLPPGNGAGQTDYETNHPGVASLLDKNFATSTTTWVTTGTGTHKSVFDALAVNVTGSSQTDGSTGTGFAYVAVPYNNAVTLFESEQYEISNGTVQAISYYGDEITPGGYNGVIPEYGRVLADGSPGGFYHYTYSTADTDNNP
jgi:hypothetical protein